MPYGEKLLGITGRCVTEDAKGTLRCGSPGITLCSCGPYSWVLGVPYEGKRITDGCVTEDLAGSLRCGSPGIALCGCSSYCGGLIVPNVEERPEIPGRLVTVDRLKTLR